MEADGTYVLSGARVRAAPGNGDGSLEDEAGRGMMTPLASEAARAMLSATVRPGLQEFVAKLPAAQLVPKG